MIRHTHQGIPIEFDHWVHQCPVYRAGVRNVGYILVDGTGKFGTVLAMDHDRFPLAISPLVDAKDRDQALNWLCDQLAALDATEQKVAFLPRGAFQW